MLYFEPICHKTLAAGTCGSVAHEPDLCTINKSSAEMTDSCYSSATHTTVDTVTFMLACLS